jgi:hypothetical protein
MDEDLERKGSQIRRALWAIVDSVSRNKSHCSFDLLVQCYRYAVVKDGTMVEIPFFVDGLHKSVSSTPLFSRNGWNGRV